MRIVYIPRLGFKSFRSIDVISHLFRIVINFRSLERFFVVRVAQLCTAYSNCIATASASVDAVVKSVFHILLCDFKCIIGSERQSAESEKEKIRSKCDRRERSGVE